MQLDGAFMLLFDSNPRPSVLNLSDQDSVLSVIASDQDKQTLERLKEYELQNKFIIEDKFRIRRVLRLKTAIYYLTNSDDVFFLDTPYQKIKHFARDVREIQLFEGKLYLMMQSGELMVTAGGSDQSLLPVFAFTVQDGQVILAFSVDTSLVLGCLWTQKKNKLFWASAKQVLAAASTAAKPQQLFAFMEDEQKTGMVKSISSSPFHSHSLYFINCHLLMKALIFDAKSLRLFPFTKFQLGRRC